MDQEKNLVKNPFLNVLSEDEAYTESYTDKALSQLNKSTSTLDERLKSLEYRLVPVLPSNRTTNKINREVDSGVDEPSKQSYVEDSIYKAGRTIDALCVRVDELLVALRI